MKNATATSHGRSRLVETDGGREEAWAGLKKIPGRWKALPKYIHSHFAQDIERHEQTLWL
jgi:hypothetical protein